MATPRIFQDNAFSIGQTYTLSEDAFGHCIRVLRLNNNDNIILFNAIADNNQYYQYTGVLSNVGKKRADVTITSSEIIDNESPVNIHLGQGISRSDRMDFTLQKSVELGVKTITPLFTERCGVKLSGERLNKKQQQWQKIVISACEQSGRCYVPTVNTPIYLNDWLLQQSNALKINLHPKAQQSIMHLSKANNDIRLLIGPEGGLSDNEISNANNAGFIDVLLGPRVLRTETAALTAITAIQCRFGDLM